MKELLDGVAALVGLVSSEKVQAIANRIRMTSPNKANAALSSIVGTPAAAGIVGQLIEVWKSTTVSANELSSMLLAASHVQIKSSSQQSTELVWTGPITPFVSVRRTEQALLQVINAAKNNLFITSFVAYEVSTIVKALNDATDRGVAISMLLESSQDYGGIINFDVIGKMRTLIPLSKFYAWCNKTDSFSDGRVHAKVAVADDNMCFITSANLTGYALEKNMEAGVLINGGLIPKQISEHLNYLVSMELVTECV